ncbi:MAG: RHS repeat-associated core domain-containing protein [Deltaproteobacteria bacterium]|nr:RHS repeat-associated core domain-containing protein [Deltaproteobacteria bacterium]
MIRWSFIFALCFGMAHAEVSYFHSDHLGSTSVTTNSAGAVQQIEYYTPFGEILRGEERGEGATPYLYTAQELDRDSELFYYNARYYDPSLARFYSRDPLFKTSPQKLNPYLYVGGNPCRFTDPSGEDWRDVVSGAWDETKYILSEGTILPRGPAKGVDVEDYERGRLAARAAMATKGVAEITGGIVLIGGGVGLEVGSLGTGTLVATGAVVVGSVLVRDGAANIGIAAVESMNSYMKSHEAPGPSGKSVRDGHSLQWETEGKFPEELDYEGERIGQMRETSSRARKELDQARRSFEAYPDDSTWQGLQKSIRRARELSPSLRAGPREALETAIGDAEMALRAQE